MAIDMTETREGIDELADYGEYVAGPLERLESRLPSLPAASLRLQRSFAERTRTLACSGLETARTSVGAIARAAATAARTVVGTARWSTERTVEAGRVGVKTVWGQGKAQVERTATVTSSEIGGVSTSLEGAVRRASDAAVDAIDAAAGGADPERAPALDYAHWTKAELYETAQELDIDGRSTMNKAELVAAVRAAA